LKRFEREIGILKRLTHPNVVRYYGGGTHEGQRWYAMELIDGGSLNDILRKRKRLSWDQAIQVGRQLCSALEHAHNAGIIHRDLKPANLFVTKKGRIKLGDFGIARDTEATALTAAGKTVGTYAYMAPEQIQGNTAITKKTDLYATGCLLYELLTGETPFVTANPAEMLMMHLNDAPYSLREKGVDCPPALDALIERMLEKDPQERPFDALAVHTELGEILKRGLSGSAEASVEALAAAGASSTASVNPETGEVKPKKKKKKRSTGPFWEKTWFLVACLTVLVAGSLWMLSGPSEDDLFLQAKDVADKAQSISDHSDASSKFLRPYLEIYPDGAHAEDVRKMLARAEVAVLESQLRVRLDKGLKGRNAWESACLRAAEAGSDPKANPLEAIDLYQQLIGELNGPASTPEGEGSEDTSNTATLDSRREALDEPAYWMTISRKRRDELIAQLILNPDRDSKLRERMEFINTLLAGDDPDDGLTALQRFIDACREEPAMDTWSDYARRRIRGEKVPLPDVEPGGTTETESAPAP
jgi:serine/threonine-protein kinase